MKLERWRGAFTAILLVLPATVAIAADAAGVAAGPVANTAVAGAPVVYVSDFDLDVSDVKPDSGKVQETRRTIGGLIPRGPLRSQKDPDAQAREIVSKMSEDLTADLVKAGVAAQRLAPGAPVPDRGWRVRGVFLAVDEGNRLRRAVVGFGAGQGSLQVAVAFDDLTKPGQAPLYENVEDSTEKAKPGAIIKLNPYVVAAKFVLDGRDESSMIKHAAQQISDAVVERMHGVTQ